MSKKRLPAKMKDSFTDFLRQASAGNEALPATVRELEDAIGVRLVIAGGQDPEAAGFVNWRVAFYVAGDLNNFLALLDDWFVFKAATREQPFEVRLLPHSGVQVQANEHWQYEHYSLSEPSSTLPLLFFEAQPCVGKRIVTLNMQVESERELSVVITGNTWAFRQRLDAHGVQGGYTEAAEEGQQRTYYRLTAHVKAAVLRTRPICFQRPRDNSNIAGTSFQMGCQVIQDFEKR